jgi:bifunctional DNA-binding transcriptional regulator/antitoxin component of YhaV-PrlF toxin-antitoxin module
MTTVTVTSKGQFTFNKSTMKHLGIQTGDKAPVKKMPDGTVSLEAEKKLHPIESLFGLLGHSETHMTIEEMKAFTEKAYAEAGLRFIRLRKFRGRMPANFQFDREEIHERNSDK